MPGTAAIIRNGIAVTGQTWPYKLDVVGGANDLATIKSDFADVIVAAAGISGSWQGTEWHIVQAFIAYLRDGVGQMPWTGFNSDAATGTKALPILQAFAADGLVKAWGTGDTTGVVTWIGTKSAVTGITQVAAGSTFGAYLQYGDVYVGATGIDDVILGNPHEIVAIACGTNFVLQLEDDGSVEINIITGSDTFGVLSIPAVLGENNDAVQVAAGANFCAVLRETGTVVTWGDLGTDAAYNTAWDTHVVSIACGGRHVVALLDDGTVVAWGANGAGQCTVPDLTGKSVIELHAGFDRSYVMYQLANLNFGNLSFGSPITLTNLSGKKNAFANPQRSYIIGENPNAAISVIGMDGSRQPATVDRTRGAYVGNGIGIKFGGLASDGTTYLADTWKFDSATGDFTQQFPSSSPPARADHIMAWDSVRSKLVVAFGTISGTISTFLSDTWEYDVSAGTWTQALASSGSARNSGAAAFNVAKQRVETFGGVANTGVYDTLFAQWNGSSWSSTTRITTNKPAARAFHAMAYVSGGANPGLLIFGGYDGVTVNQETCRLKDAANVWEKDAALAPAHKPGIRLRTRMVYDSVNDRVVLFGGDDGTASPSAYQDTWTWDGTDWTDRTAAGTPPAARSGHAMWYDSNTGEVFIHGGFENGVGYKNDTWKMNTTTFVWTQVVTDDKPLGSLPALPSGQEWVGFAPGNKFAIGLTRHYYACGSITGVLIGLCQSYGIGARIVGGTGVFGGTFSCAGDSVCEVFLTSIGQTGKWVLVWPHAGMWLEKNGVPMSMAEVRAARTAGDLTITASYEIGVPGRGFKIVSNNNAGIVAMGGGKTLCTPTVFPRNALRFWSDVGDLIGLVFVSAETKLNNAAPSRVTVQIDDYTTNEDVTHCNAGSIHLNDLATGDDDLNITYTINNIHVAMTGTDPGPYHLTLSHNMVAETGGFTKYQVSYDDGATWIDNNLTAEGGGVYTWSPVGSQSLFIRGINAAGVTSPYVELQFSDDAVSRRRRKSFYP